MAQTGYTPILIYASGTTGNTPSAANLTSSASGAELALNYFDGKLFYKDASGNVQVLAGKGGTGVVAGSNTQIQFNNNGVFGAAAGLTWDGTYLTANSLKDSALTSGSVIYAGASGLLQDSANLTFDGTTLTANALSVTNGVTLSGGTANGVAYLNGSKVLTTGSALTFDGSNFVQTATSTSYAKVRSSGSGTVAASLYQNADTGTTDSDGFFVGTIGNTPYIYNYENSPLIFATNSSEQMRLTSTGLGIGTSSPYEKLTVQGSQPSIGISGGTGTTGSPAYTTLAFRGYVGNRTAAIRSFDQSSSTAAGGGLEFLVNSNLAADTLSSAMRIDASGNLGLGVTPSAWSTGKNIQLPFAGGVSGIFGTDVFALLGSNAYYNTGWKYNTTGNSALYAQSSGAHQWLTAPSGTAGAAITFTQAMTLDASGNLLVGTTTSSKKLTLYGDQIIGNGALYLSNFSFDASLSKLYWDNTNNLTVIDHTYPLGGINFRTNGADRARIDASGNLLVGTTSVGTVTGNCFGAAPVSGGANIFIGHVSGSASGQNYAGFLYNGGTIGSITQNGTTAVAYNTTSDHRLKTNVRSADVLKFMDIEFVDFEWVDGRHDCGVIADRLQAVYPSLVIGQKDATEVRTVEITPAVPAVTDAEGNVVSPEVPAVTEEQTFPVYQQVNYMGLIPRMGAMIQKQQRLIEALEARITALEAK